MITQIQDKTCAPIETGILNYLMFLRVHGDHGHLYWLIHQKEAQ